MKRSTLAVVIIVSLLGLVQTIGGSLASYFASRAQAAAMALQESDSSFSNNSLERDILELHRSWGQAEPFAEFKPDAFQALGRSAMLMAGIGSDYDQKIYFLCQALRYFADAVQASPLRPDFHIALADLQYQLPHASRLCGGLPFDADAMQSPEARLNYAVELAPQSVEDSYNASVVYLTAGNKHAALKLLRHNQETNPLFTDAQRDYVFRFITSETDLRVGIPRTYPEILSWIYHFYYDQPNEYRRWRSTFEDALVDSLRELESRREDHRIDAAYFSSFLKNIAALPLAATSPKLRPRLDQVLATIYQAEGNSAWGELLARRAERDRLPVLKSIIIDDLSPLRTMLFAWRPDEEYRTASLDSLGRSIGVFVPEGSIPTMLVLESQTGGSRLRTTELELLGSNNNLRFHSLENSGTWQSYLIDGREVFVFEFTSSPTRFLKIRYTGAERQPKFFNRFDRLIQVYGETQS
ncbi:MAG: hypothetical protein KDD44_01700 [Bdellovibrionales bacterium]|nr:hypothetical protein [Bdellovibrionales bacterium]